MATFPAPVESERTPPKQRTLSFDCTDCGKVFRTRTKAGIHARCPRCGGIALGTTLKDRLILGSERRVQADDASRGARRRSAARAADQLAAAPTDAPLAPILEPMPAEAQRRPKPSHAIPPASPTPTPAPSHQEQAGAALGPPSPRRPGLLARIIGTDD